MGTGIGLAKKAKVIVRGEDPTNSFLENGVWRQHLGRSCGFRLWHGPNQY